MIDISKGEYLTAIASAATTSTSDHKLTHIAVPSFLQFLTLNKIEANLRESLDLWRQANVDVLHTQTLTKCYNTLKRIIEAIGAAGLLPQTECNTSRILPKLASNGDPLGLRAYDLFNDWLKNRPNQTTITQNDLRLYSLYLGHSQSGCNTNEYGHLADFWNRELKRAFNRWPTAPIEGDGAKLLYGIPLEYWPNGIQKAFSIYASAASPSTEFNPDINYTEQRKNLAEDTITQYAAKLGRYLGFVSIYYPDLLTSAHTDFLLHDQQLIKQFIEWHIGHCSKDQEKHFHKDFCWILGSILEAIGMTHQAVEIRNLSSHLRPIPANPFDEINTPDYAQLSCACEQALSDTKNLVLEIENGDEARKITAAADYSRILAFALLTWRPLRGHNCREMQLQKNLYELNGTWYLRFSQPETKNKQPICVEWPKYLQPYLEAYLNIARPYLATEGENTVFLTEKHVPFSKFTWGIAFSWIGNRYFNRHIKPHAFRRWMTCSYLAANPGDFETCRALLGHNCISTTLKYYAFAFSRQASLKSAEFLLDCCPSLAQIGDWRPQ